MPSEDTGWTNFQLFYDVGLAFIFFKFNLLNPYHSGGLVGWVSDYNQLIFVALISQPPQNVIIENQKYLAP